MLTSRIIPCLDVSDNRVVKGVRFSGLRDVGSPVEMASIYESQGADEIVVLDISATNRRQQTQLQCIREVRSVLSIPLTVGGGIRTMEDILRLTDAGADRISLNTAAVDRPELITESANRFGQQCTVIAIDARRDDSDWQVITHAGKTQTGIAVVDWAQKVEALGAGEILLTSFDRDGTRNGYDCELLRQVTGAVSIPVIASGGADCASHLRDGFQSGATAVLLASILHDGVTTVAELKKELIEMGLTIRP